MDVQDLMGRVVDELYAGLTGGSAELPLPSRTKINWVLQASHSTRVSSILQSRVSSPSPATLDEFEKMVKAIEGQNGGDGDGNGGNSISRAQVIEAAKLMWQQHLLGTWEQWSRLVDFIPLMNPSEAQMSWSATSDQGSQGHKGIVYGQAGQTFSNLQGYARQMSRRGRTADGPTKRRSSSE